ncbi:MAG: phosphatase PAP2 family protein, partial [Candidatus Saccharimonas sp.]|nr:phosphatase PAP2 family protein [Planctomycetaceae bacterium]
VTAVGLAVVLAAWYPRGRWLFATLAVLVGMNRMQCLAHFPSDVFSGAALGWIVGSCCVLGDRRWSLRITHINEVSG